ncbi:hypothetical protein EDB81DRAFT_931881 [Dactylonectria macrodidyma]|uniref:Uncharacterized protein n=1 Tax=Dactylonectria macrodidyma TaxID=307937 RepID=A0A9P9F4A3_9HYPO|nr:hypothetical protein EDB81DRAFT_931881 [Dactylonectria macrodidyma]
MENTAREDDVPVSKIMKASIPDDDDTVSRDTTALSKLSELHLTANELNICNPFLSVPDEIILLIVEKGSLDRSSLRNLALTSSRLFRLARPSFYKGYNYETFRQAVAHVDIAAMERCAMFDAAPVKHQWDVGCTCRQPACFQAWEGSITPLGILVSGFWGYDTEEICLPVEDDRLNAVKWLLDHGANPNSPSAAVRCPYDPDYETRVDYDSEGEFGLFACKPVMLHLLPWLLKEDITKERIDAMSRLVYLLCVRGGAMPLRLDPTLLPRHPGKIAANTFAGLLRPRNSRKWSYPEEAVDMMEEKVKLLVHFKAVDTVEQDAFEKLVGAMRELSPLCPALTRRDSWDPRSMWHDHVMGNMERALEDTQSSLMDRWRIAFEKDYDQQTDHTRWYDADMGQWMDGLKHTLAFKRRYPRDVYMDDDLDYGGDD